jgi:predicted transcriptional regulator
MSAGGGAGMASVITISDEAKAVAEQLVREGRFGSIDQAFEAGIHHLVEWDDQAVDLDDLSPEDRAAVEEGLADIEAGRVHDADEVFESLRERLRQL